MAFRCLELMFKKKIRLYFHNGVVRELNGKLSRQLLLLDVLNINLLLNCWNCFFYP